MLGAAAAERGQREEGKRRALGKRARGSGKPGQPERDWPGCGAAGASWPRLARDRQPQSAIIRPWRPGRAAVSAAIDRKLPTGMREESIISASPSPVRRSLITRWPPPPLLLSAWRGGPTAGLFAKLIRRWRRTAAVAAVSWPFIAFWGGARTRFRDAWGAAPDQTLHILSLWQEARRFDAAAARHSPTDSPIPPGSSRLARHHSWRASLGTDCWEPSDPGDVSHSGSDGMARRRDIDAFLAGRLSTDPPRTVPRALLTALRPGQ
ncbi:hypothetical protein PVAR5_6660 [Paecilomyces variotii No. 5]|uniref:Uncharacterized protein n=1 Tax=Byssochlamys spectabilis (strain No. 5 / NBRC 109023) TaxID=1356009 RepID=V5GAN2_BYSSN|nr:hypothetical protein PVAR5_6660 [Paecilomyces variotii No. 5]